MPVAYDDLTRFRKVLRIIGSVIIPVLALPFIVVACLAMDAYVKARRREVRAGEADEARDV